MLVMGAVLDYNHDGAATWPACRPSLRGGRLHSLREVVRVMRKTLEERFWEKVDVKGPDECWEWTACKIKDGYGHIRGGGDSQKLLLAHRISWEIHNGPIPKGMQVHHHCDNPGCVNPAHLWTGSQADNIRDRDEKGRQIHPRGEAHGRTHQSEQTVREIRTLAREERLTQQEIGARYGIASSTVNSIKTGENWGWLE